MICDASSYIYTSIGTSIELAAVRTNPGFTSGAVIASVRRAGRDSGRLIAGLERGHGIDKRPAQRAGDVDDGDDVEHQVPIAMRAFEEKSAEDRSDERGEIADGIHRPGDGSGESSADVHAGMPGGRHDDVVTETRQ